MGACEEKGDSVLVLKAAKKSLKRQDSGSMKLKALAKKVGEKVGNQDVKSVKKLIKQSKKFSIDDNNMVSLSSKKRSLEISDDKIKKSNKKTRVDDSASTAVGIDKDLGVKWRKDHKIILKAATDKQDSGVIEDDKQFFPLMTFNHCKEDERMASSLLRQCTEGNGFLKPSPIQAQCWPIMLSTHENKKRDVVGIAETGSGKTLAFALPALSAMFGKKLKSPRMLVLAPTRELAMQSHEVLQEFGSVVGLSSLVVYGGVPKHQQSSTLRRGKVDCLVATPGRLKDLLHDGVCDLSNVQHLVLDEADRMLDMGFLEDIRSIISQCQSKQQRQTAMFSATWPLAIQQIAMEFMVDPIRVYVGFDAKTVENLGNDDSSLCANKRVSQTVEVIEDRARESRIRQLLKEYHAKRDNRVLIFCLYKKEAERLERSLQRDGWNCGSIHGNKHQAARTAALSKFKDASCPLLIATDVAARGLDIPSVEVVINYTFPLTIEDYVHRIGRTGRAGKTGKSHTFFQPGDKSHAGELQQVLKQAGQPVPDSLMKFGSTIKKKEHKLYGNFGPKTGQPMKKATKITFNHSEDEED